MMRRSLSALAASFSMVSVLVVAVLGVALFCSAPALAARGHVFSKSFGGSCAAEPCKGNFKEPSGIAVNEATGDIYVVDRGANRVARLSSEGVFQSEVNGSGTLAGEEVEAGNGGRAGEVKTGRFSFPAGEEPSSRLAETSGVAVDNSCFFQEHFKAAKRRVKIRPTGMCMCLTRATR